MVKDSGLGEEVSLSVEIETCTLPLDRLRLVRELATIYLRWQIGRHVPPPPMGDAAATAASR
jgi:hypothetical protein